MEALNSNLLFMLESSFTLTIIPSAVRLSCLKMTIHAQFSSVIDFDPKVGQIDLVFVWGEGLSVGLYVRNYSGHYPCRNDAHAPALRYFRV